MALNQTKPKYQVIAEDLRDQINGGTFRAGEMLPSYRVLMKQHGVTVGTIRQAMQTLQSEKLVNSLPRVGCVVAERPLTWRRVGVSIFGAQNPTYMFVLEALYGAFAKLHCDVAVNFIQETDDKTIAALIEWGQRQDGMLLIGWVPVGILKAVDRARLRVVQCGEPTDGPCPPEVSSVLVDTDSVVGLALGHLTALGHRHIMLCTHTGSRYFDTLQSSFHVHCAEYGVEESAHLFEAGKEDLFKDLIERLNAMQKPPTALLVDNGRVASQAIEALTANGWPVPDRIGVLATALATHEPGIMDGLTCVLTATRAMFLRAVHILLSIIESDNQNRRHEMVVAKYIPGRTCIAASET